MTARDILSLQPGDTVQLTYGQGIIGTVTNVYPETLCFEVDWPGYLKKTYCPASSQDIIVYKC